VGVLPKNDEAVAAVQLDSMSGHLWPHGSNRVEHAKRAVTL